MTGCRALTAACPPPYHSTSQPGLGSSSARAGRCRRSRHGAPAGDAPLSPVLHAGSHHHRRWRRPRQRRAATMAAGTANARSLAAADVPVGRRTSSSPSAAHRSQNAATMGRWHSAPVALSSPHRMLGDRLGHAISAKTSSKACHGISSAQPDAVGRQGAMKGPPRRRRQGPSGRGCVAAHLRPPTLHQHGDHLVPGGGTKAGCAQQVAAQPSELRVRQVGRQAPQRRRGMRGFLAGQLQASGGAQSGG
jgi:hypothetical protein